ncbi:hypothetical protein B0A48_11029 [Cryoendolithus antarcticus]|uniref:Uncharacterized protein n=1 Tax=Cryoendolithus antarcticus TaxID=1507870 RepID=A0A1V8SZM6_9PEZI|nr:hypothetical protein B0A48_11029 [Cryoendolithus antarcticus]
MELVPKRSENGSVPENSQLQNLAAQRTSSRKPSGKIPTIATAWFAKVTDRQRKVKTSTKQNAAVAAPTREDLVDQSPQMMQRPTFTSRLELSLLPENLGSGSQPSNAANASARRPPELTGIEQPALQSSGAHVAALKQDDATAMQALQPSKRKKESSSVLPTDLVPAVKTDGGLASPAAPELQELPESSRPANLIDLDAIEEASEKAPERAPEAQTAYEKRAEVAKGRIWTWLQHHMRGFERVQAAVSVESTRDGDRILISVTCSGRAVAKRREIESILHNRSMRSELREFRVEVSETTDHTGFWFTGPSMMSDIRIVDGDHARVNVANYHAGQESLHFHWEKDEDPGVPFALSPYWTTGAALVEYTRPRRSGHGDETFSGTLIRTQNKSSNSPSTNIFWTYGGPIYVDGQLYGFTTAHPLVYSRTSGDDYISKGKEPVPHHSSTSYGEEDEMYEEWRPLGLIGRYALADFGSVPAGNDWMLIDLIKNTLPPSLVYTHSDLVVQTHLGLVSGTLLPGSSFIILGTSSFEAAKVELAKPLKNGDSGAVVVRGGELFGIVIASGLDLSGRPFAYILKAQDVCKSVSDGIAGATVRFPTSSENAIFAHQTLYPDTRFITLASLYVDQLFSDAFICSHVTIAAPTLRNSDPLIDALLLLGAGYRSAPTRRVEVLTRLTSRKHRFKATVTYFPGALSTATWRMLAMSQGGVEAAEVVFALLQFLEPYATVDILLGIFKELGVHVMPSRKTVSHAVYEMNDIPPIAPLEDLRHDVRNPDPGFNFMYKALARIIYAAQISAYYVYTGPWAMWLYKIVAVWLGYNGVYKVQRGVRLALFYRGLQCDADSLPFIFLQSTPEGTLLEGPNVTKYGNIIDCPELKLVLKRILDDPDGMLESERADRVNAVDGHRVDALSDHEDPESTRYRLQRWAELRSNEVRFLSRVR